VGRSSIRLKEDLVMNQPTSTLGHVTSQDGTTIGFDRLGDGPPVILVTGGSVDRRSNAGLAAALAGEFTVYNYDRRGRGDSGDTLPYAIDREIEDIAAVTEAAGGKTNLYGISSGGVLAMLAAEKLPGLISRLAVYEPPFISDPAARPPDDTVEQYERAVAAGRPGDAVEVFMAKVVKMPPEFVEFAKTQPFWADQEKIAHTLAYDGRIMRDYSLPLDQAGRIGVPTLIVAGGADFPFMRETAQALADAIPNGQVRFLDGQGHNVDPTVLAPVLMEFFRG
jgi:pimeloyl-ACP methyl ester carboxylesterase